MFQGTSGPGGTVTWPATWHYMPEDLTTQKHRCKNLKSHKL